ncbi:MAG: peptidoglycan-binding protein [Verrucomicrobia bacterium]|nr:peptidoglycan-binding protein [Verrucomicrobiota bacterium]
MRKLFWFSAALFLMPAFWAEGQNLGRSVMVFNSAPSVHVQPAGHPNAPIIVQVPRVSPDQAQAIQSASTSRFLLFNNINRSALDSAVPVAPRTVQPMRPVNRLPLGTTVESADLTAANGYTVRQVRQVQQALRRLGYYSGAVDGSFGPNTQNAVETYQLRTGEPVTGTLTVGVLSRLGVNLDR